MPLTVLLLNANRLNHPAKRHSLWKTAMDLKCDILFTSTAAPTCRNKHFSQIFSAPFTSKKRGVLIAVKDSVSFHMKHSVLDTEGRYIILMCTINNIAYTLVNIYAPNVKQMKFLRKLMKVVYPLKIITSCITHHTLQSLKSN